MDRTLEMLLKLEFGASLPFDLSFAPPDRSFGPVTGTKNTLNCYLYDIRENRELRSVEPRLKRRADGTVEKEYPPARVRLSYCITAWSPAQLTPGTAPALDEHRLLGDVLRALLKYPELPAAALVGELAGQEPPLPATLIVPDGPRSAEDFWNAIGGQLRPSLNYSITLSLAYQPPSTSPMVTTAQRVVGSPGEGGRIVPGQGDGLFLIGGTVRASPSLEGVAAAWVRVDQTGQTYVTDAEGRFLIDRIAAGTSTLVVRAVGFQEASRSVRIPQPDGQYDVTLIPLP